MAGKNREVLLDTESDGLNPTKIYCMVMKDINSGEVFKFELDDCAISGKKFLEEEVCTIIGHNVIEYDIPRVLKRFVGIDWKVENCVDTYVLSRVAYSDRYQRDIKVYGGEGNIPSQYKTVLRENSHSLAAWGIRVGRYKPEIEDWSRYTPDILNRCVEDVEINLLAYRLLQKELQGFSEYSVRLEHRVADIIAEQCRNGCTIDRTVCGDLLEECSKKATQTKEEIIKEIPPLVHSGETIIPKITEVKVWTGSYTVNANGRKVKEYEIHKTISSQTKGFKAIREAGFKVVGPYSLVDFVPFNPDSPDQRLAVLEKAGWNPINFNKPSPKMIKEGRKKGNPKTTDEENLKTISPSAPQGIKKLGKYVMLTNRAMLASEWLKLSDNSEHKIYGRVNSVGTPSSRMRHFSPNLANIPSVEVGDDGLPLRGEIGLYGWECRSCFTVSDTSKYALVGFDAAALEIRMLAHYMQDDLFILEVLTGDIYTKIQVAVGLPSRKIAKAVLLALIYGAGDAKLGLLVGGKAKAGKIIRAKVLDYLPSLNHLIIQVQNEAQTKGYLRGLDGRKLWVRKPHAALNTLCQSAGAIVMKKCLIDVYKKAKEAGLDCQLLLSVHDEFQFECRKEDVEKLGELMVDSIKNSGEFFKMNIPLSGSWKQGSAWSFTH